MWRRLTTSPTTQLLNLINTVEANAAAEQCLHKWQQQACVWATIKHISWSYVAFQWQAEEGLSVKLQKKGKTAVAGGLKPSCSHIWEANSFHLFHSVVSHIHSVRRLSMQRAAYIRCSCSRGMLSVTFHCSCTIRWMWCVVVCLRLLPQCSPFSQCGIQVATWALVFPQLPSFIMYWYVNVRLCCVRDLKQPLCHLAHSFILCVRVCQCSWYLPSFTL